MGGLRPGQGDAVHTQRRAVGAVAAFTPSAGPTTVRVASGWATTVAVAADRSVDRRGAWAAHVGGGRVPACLLVRGRRAPRAAARGRRAEPGNARAGRAVGRLDLDLLRALGSGLAARVWATLEAWGRWPARSLDGQQEECAIGLGEPARQSLGVGGYKQASQARAALDRAGARIAAADPSYELIRCERRAGWCLVVRRLSGARARARARSDAPWRSKGIAATKHERPERAAVRAAAAESLDSVRSDRKIAFRQPRPPG